MYKESALCCIQASFFSYAAYFILHLRIACYTDTAIAFIYYIIVHLTIAILSGTAPGHNLQIMQNPAAVCLLLAHPKEQKIAFLYFKN